MGVISEARGPFHGVKWVLFAVRFAALMLDTMASSR